MPLPLAPLDPALFHRTHAPRAAAIARGIAAPFLAAGMLLARFLAWLLFWPTMAFLFVCAIGVPVFASQGWWWDVAQCVFYGLGALAAYGVLARTGEYGHSGGVP